MGFSIEPYQFSNRFVLCLQLKIVHKLFEFGFYFIRARYFYKFRHFYLISRINTSLLNLAFMVSINNIELMESIQTVYV